MAPVASRQLVGCKPIFCTVKLRGLQFKKQVYTWPISPGDLRSASLHQVTWQSGPQGGEVPTSTGMHRSTPCYAAAIAAHVMIRLLHLSLSGFRCMFGFSSTAFARHPPLLRKPHKLSRSLLQQTHMTGIHIPTHFPARGDSQKLVSPREAAPA